jgi:hypothetical protein
MKQLKKKKGSVQKILDLDPGGLNSNWSYGSGLGTLQKKTIFRHKNLVWRSLAWWRRGGGGRRSSSADRQWGCVTCPVVGLNLQMSFPIFKICKNSKFGQKSMRMCDLSCRVKLSKMSFPFSKNVKIQNLDKTVTKNCILHFKLPFFYRWIFWRFFNNLSKTEFSAFAQNCPYFFI